MSSTSHLGPVHDGFDGEVLMCPGHEWIEEDRTPKGQESSDWYICHVCTNCRAIRCDSGTETLRCLEARHHVLLPHRTSDGNTWPISMNPEDSTEGGRWHL